MWHNKKSNEEAARMRVMPISLNVDFSAHVNYRSAVRDRIDYFTQYKDFFMKKFMFLLLLLSSTFVSQSYTFNTKNLVEFLTPRNTLLTATGILLLSSLGFYAQAVHKEGKHYSIGQRMTNEPLRKGSARLLEAGILTGTAALMTYVGPPYWQRLTQSCCWAKGMVWGAAGFAGTLFYIIGFKKLNEQLNKRSKGRYQQMQPEDLQQNNNNI